MQASPDSADEARLTGPRQSFLLDETFNGDEDTTAAHDERTQAPIRVSSQDPYIGEKQSDTHSIALTSEEMANIKVEKREAALRRERDGLAKFNTLLERAIVSFETAIPKAVALTKTVDDTHALLDTYSSIVNQADHIYTLVGDSKWEAEQDLQDIEVERQAAEREKQTEIEQARRADQQRKEQEMKEAQIVQEATRKASQPSGMRSRGQASKPSGSMATRQRGRGTTTSRIATGSGVARARSLSQASRPP